MKRETKQTGEDEGGYTEEDGGIERRSSTGGGSLRKGEGSLKRFSYVNDEAKYNVEKDLLRMLAEVHFINAEVRNVGSHIFDFISLLCRDDCEVIDFVYF